MSPIPSIELPPSDPNLQELIAQQTILQRVDEIYRPTQTLRESSTPNDILAELISTFAQHPDNPYSIGIYRRQGQPADRGPYPAPLSHQNPRGQVKFRVYVYDSNFPPSSCGPILPILPSTLADNTWTYDPGEAAADYRGDASTKNLDLTRLGWRYAGAGSTDADQGLFTCPFCSATQAPQSLDIALIGEGDLAVYRLNSATNEYVSVQPDSDLVPFKGRARSSGALPLSPDDRPLRSAVEGGD